MEQQTNNENIVFLYAFQKWDLALHYVIKSYNLMSGILFLMVSLKEG